MSPHLRAAKRGVSSRRDEHRHAPPLLRLSDCSGATLARERDGFPLSCAGREGREKEAGCAGPTACRSRALERLHSEVRKCHADPGSDLGQSRAISLGWLLGRLLRIVFGRIKCC